MGDNKVKAFQVFYPMDNEFEITRGFLIGYLCMEYAMRRIPSIPSESLITALVFYIMHGYTYEAKEKIMKYCKHKTMQSVDQVNLKLKQSGFLVDNMISKKNKSLNESLIKLSDYVHNNKHTGQFIMMSVIQQKDGRSEKV